MNFFLGLFYSMNNNPELFIVPQIPIFQLLSNLFLFFSESFQILHGLLFMDYCTCLLRAENWKLYYLPITHPFNFYCQAYARHW